MQLNSFLLLFLEASKSVQSGPLRHITVCTVMSHLLLFIRQLASNTAEMTRHLVQLHNAHPQLQQIHPRFPTVCNPHGDASVPPQHVMHPALQNAWFDARGRPVVLYVSPPHDEQFSYTVVRN